LSNFTVHFNLDIKWTEVYDLVIVL
jgi:hypothetical protein